MRFRDNVVAITGAAQGIGRQTAEQAAAEGAALLLIDRSPWVNEMSETRAQSGSKVLAMEADLEQWPSPEQAFADAVAHYGRIE
ncbi:SDR family NAD(P)-dependent oxidoreductase, partial [Klebsiella quasipneumoniae]|uniref:SDR family NAD(P)-dependent oxidoreductase n=1 Tax=Klebsiella quasipneumoniae TaxID=1463165 RepID=UPI0011129652